MFVIGPVQQSSEGKQRLDLGMKQGLGWLLVIIST
jgi:hypothetical protein